MVQVLNRKAIQSFKELQHALAKLSEQAQTDQEPTLGINHLAVSPDISIVTRPCFRSNCHYMLMLTGIINITLLPCMLQVWGVYFAP